MAVPKKLPAWTLDLEIKLLDALEKYPVVGVDRHFNLVNICVLLERTAGVELPCKSIWEHLLQFYDLDSPLLIDDDEIDKKLVESLFKVPKNFIPDETWETWFGGSESGSGSGSEQPADVDDDDDEPLVQEAPGDHPSLKRKDITTTEETDFSMRKKLKSAEAGFNEGERVSAH